MSPAIEAKHLIGQTDYLVTFNVTDLKGKAYIHIGVYTCARIYTYFMLKRDYTHHLTLTIPKFKVQIM